MLDYYFLMLIFWSHFYNFIILDEFLYTVLCTRTFVYRGCATKYTKTRKFTLHYNILIVKKGQNPYKYR